MTRFKLANIILKREAHFAQFPELLYRVESNVDYCEENDSLAFEGTIDFLTYFNAISVGKWRTYTGIDTIALHLELAGDACMINLNGVQEGAVSPADCPSGYIVSTTSSVHRNVSPISVGKSIPFEGSDAFTSIDIRLPIDGLILGGFELRSSGATEIRNAYWYTDIDEDKIRDIRIALVTTTFKNEQYIIPNIEKVKSHILASDDPIARGFHMFVIDNGNTLDAHALQTDGVSIVPNANMGGAGGFARGMIETLEASEEYTHVLLMDDDVQVSPESFKRTFNLLSLTNDTYVDAFINGAMLQLGKPNIQFEDVSNVRKDGLYLRLKGNLIVDNLADIAVNEVVDVEVPDAYGAWWYSCIPVAKIRECGLPLPLFVRCDDVEYGLRCQPTYMTMNGICVWHAEFGSKFRAAVDCYQYVRNYLIMTALHEKSFEALFMARVDRTFRLYLRSMAYETAELVIKGLEDYLRGPEFLMSASGEDIMKENNAQAEKLVPLDEALANASEEHPALAPRLSSFTPDLDIVRDNQHVNSLLKLWRTLPYDRHLLPEALLRNHPATAYYGGYTVSSPDQIATRVLVACDREGKHAHVRFLDRKRYRALKKRWRDAKRSYKKNGAQIKQAYRDAFPQLTSREFWKSYLGMQQ